MHPMSSVCTVHKHTAACATQLINALECLSLGATTSQSQEAVELVYGTGESPQLESQIITAPRRPFDATTVGDGQSTAREM